MLASFRESCAECSGEVVDMGDELVCKSCGVVRCKEVVEVKAGGTPQAIDYTGQALGGYLGPLEYGPREKFCRGLVGSPSSSRYLKLVLDYGGREDSTVYSCVKMIERVCEKLSLPKIVMGQAIVIAKKLKEQLFKLTKLLTEKLTTPCASPFSPPSYFALGSLTRNGRLVSSQTYTIAIVSLLTFILPTTGTPASTYPLSSF